MINELYYPMVKLKNIRRQTYSEPKRHLCDLNNLGKLVTIYEHLQNQRYSKMWISKRKIELSKCIIYVFSQLKKYHSKIRLQLVATTRQ
jgi:hypothetical protein